MNLTKTCSELHLRAQERRAVPEVRGAVRGAGGAAQRDRVRRAPGGGAGARRPGAPARAREPHPHPLDAQEAPAGPVPGVRAFGSQRQTGDFLRFFAAKTLLFLSRCSGFIFRVYLPVGSF